jgi:transposase
MARWRPSMIVRPGREPTITPEAKAWLVSLACDKAKDHGYPHELWTTRLLARHAREHGPAAGHGCLAKLVQGTVCKILGQEEIKPHKVRYYLENRDAEFEQKMAEILCVYREVEVLKKAAAKGKRRGKPVTIVSCDEKPGIQAIATTAPDLPPKPGIHATFARDHEYKRHGTLSLLAGIDLLSGKVHALVKDRHRSREFIEFLRLIDAAYPPNTAIKLILDNHSAHISRETRAWLATRPSGRFELTFTPKHGSWLNLIESFFSKFARSVKRWVFTADRVWIARRDRDPGAPSPARRVRRPCLGNKVGRVASDLFHRLRNVELCVDTVLPREPGFHDTRTGWTQRE